MPLPHLWFGTGVLSLEGERAARSLAEKLTVSPSVTFAFPTFTEAHFELNTSLTSPSSVALCKPSSSAA